jgi:formylglycine-generating enzyme required for sulfatase activity
VNAGITVASLALVLAACGQREPVVVARAPRETPAASAAPLADAGPTSHEGMVRLPAGRFVMGSSTGDSEERPPHDVSVASFWMDSTEVTVASYAECVRAKVCALPATEEEPQLCNPDDRAHARHPVTCVDWGNAEAYCRWRGKRLPTEEEWEYAARGTAQRLYPWGDAAPAGRLCWRRGVTLAGTCDAGTHPTGQTPEGLQDMAGNVSEWTSSAYSEDYSKPRAGDSRMVRGGSWNDGDPAGMRGAERFSMHRLVSSPDLGFRCAAP